MTPLRVLLAPSAYYPHVGGIEEVTKRLALTLTARGYDISVLTNRWPEGVRRTEVLDGVNVIRLLFPLPGTRPRNALRFLIGSPTAALQLARHLRRVRPDVIHVIGAGPQSVYVALLARPLGSALVFTGAGELTFDAGDVFTHSASLRAGLRRMLRTADAVTACSAFVLRDLQEFGGAHSPAQVVPNGVDRAEFHDAALEVRRKLYILAVGRLVPQKGFDVLLEAFADPRLSEFKLVVAGDGVERGRLETLAHCLGLVDRVRFLGAVDRETVVRLFRGAHIFAFPSRGEAFGIALLEAMAAGVPAVAAAAGGIPEFAKDGENALLVEVDEPRQLADALARLSQDDRLRQKVIAGGERTARELDWSNVSNAYEEIYAAAIIRRRR